MKISMTFPAPRDRKLTEYSSNEFLLNDVDNSCDLIYAASVSTLEKSIQLKNKVDLPLVCWCWDLPFNWREWNMTDTGVKENSFRDGQIKQRVEMLKKCDLVITPTKWVQNTLKSEFNVDSEQIYQFIDTDEIERHPTQEKTDSITQISRFFYNKKFHHTVYATKDLNYEVNLIGTGIKNSYGKEVKKEIEETKNHNINIHDSISRGSVIEYLKKSKILVSPSVFEGWGITPIEGLYTKNCILLSDLDVFKEVYGDNVIYHDKNDKKDMKKKLEYLIKNEDVREDIINKCQPIISEFTPERYANRWDNLINTYFK